MDRQQLHARLDEMNARALEGGGAQAVERQHARGKKTARERIDALLDAGIVAGIHYPVPAHRHPAYENRVATPGPLRETERLVGEIVSLPVYPELGMDDANRVCDAILAFMARDGRDAR